MSRSTSASHHLPLPARDAGVATLNGQRIIHAKRAPHDKQASVWSCGIPWCIPTGIHKQWTHFQVEQLLSGSVGPFGGNPFAKDDHVRLRDDCAFTRRHADDEKNQQESRSMIEDGTSVQKSWQGRVNRQNVRFSGSERMPRNARGGAFHGCGRLIMARRSLRILKRVSNVPSLGTANGAMPSPAHPRPAGAGGGSAQFNAHKCDATHIAAPIARETAKVSSQVIWLAHVSSLASLQCRSEIEQDEA